MRPSSLYDLISGMPVVGGNAALTYSDAFAQEAVDNINSGTPGAGVPGLDGTPLQGTIDSGMVVALNANGNWDKATSTALGTPNLRQMFGVTHSGDEDLSGGMLGKPVVLRGRVRIRTGMFNGSSFPPGTVLVANAGKFEAKTDPNSTLQEVGFVGPLGLHPFNGGTALDVDFDPR